MLVLCCTWQACRLTCQFCNQTLVVLCEYTCARQTSCISKCEVANPALACKEWSFMSFLRFCNKRHCDTTFQFAPRVLLHCFKDYLVCGGCHCGLSMHVCFCRCVLRCTWSCTQFLVHPLWFKGCKLAWLSLRLQSIHASWHPCKGWLWQHVPLLLYCTWWRCVPGQFTYRQQSSERLNPGFCSLLQGG